MCVCVLLLQESGAEAKKKAEGEIWGILGRGQSDGREREKDNAFLVVASV